MPINETLLEETVSTAKDINTPTNTGHQKSKYILSSKSGVMIHDHMYNSLEREPIKET